jgi:hypothetical protein
MKVCGTKRVKFKRLKFEKKGIEQLGQICKINGETDWAITSGLFTTVVNNSVHYIDRTGRRYYR